MSACVYGLLAEFATPTELISAAREARRLGYRRLEAYSPIPVEGLYEALERPESKLSWLVGAAAVLGAGLGYALQYYLNVMNYPLNVGGRPLNSWPAFLIVSFEVAVLFAALAAVAGMLVANGLPRLHHPLFSVPRFADASRHRFFLCICATDQRYDSTETRQFLSGCGPQAIFEVPQ